MKILLQFYLTKKENDIEEKFLFWSCVLDTIISLGAEDFKELEERNSIVINDKFHLNIIYKEFTGNILLSEEYKNYNAKRPEVFLSCNESFSKGSPYRNASAKLKNCYQLPNKFIEELSFFCKTDKDSYEFNQLQRSLISEIKNCVGIDIIENGSIPGCLSIYEKLDAFNVDGNFNEKNGKQRYFIVSPLTNKKYDDAFIEFEIFDENSRDDKKILFKQIYKYEIKRYELPNIDKLEGFGKLRVTIFNNSASLYSVIFETTLYLIRNITINTNIHGGTTKLFKNRYLGKSNDKVIMSQRDMHSKILPKTDFSDIERSYMNLLYGKEKKFLQSQFFEKTSRGGGDKFLNWARKTIQNGGNIIIIDPYFDKNGADDLSACITSYVDVTIVTSDPVEVPRPNSADLLKIISEKFDKATVYYIPKDKIHDRYMIFNDTMFSFSNSWNGTVNKYSLFVQEVSLPISLKINDDLNQYINDKYLKELPQKQKIITSEKKDESKYTQEFAASLIEKIQNQKISIDEFIYAAQELYWSNYCTGKPEELEIEPLLIATVKNMELTKINEVINIVSSKLLKKQRDVFIEERQFIQAESVSFYSSPEKCLEQVSSRIMRPFREFELKTDYILHSLLNILFMCYPIEVIKLLEEKEKEICVVKIGDEKKELRYYMSETLVASFLSEKCYRINKPSDDIKQFVEKAKQNLYCKMFITKSALDNNKELQFNEIITQLEKFAFSNDESLLMLADLYREYLNKKLQSCDILNGILDYVKKNYTGEPLVKFVNKVFIESFGDFNINSFIDFIKDLKDSDKQEIKNLLLLKTLTIFPKLQRSVIEIISPSEYVKEFVVTRSANGHDEQSFRDISKYANVLDYIGVYFAGIICANKEIDKFDKLSHKLNVNYNLIFGISYPKDIGLFYFQALFLLATVKRLPELLIEESKIIKLLKWYLPVCLNRCAYDYGLSVRLVDLYCSVINDDDKKMLLLLLEDIPSKVMVLSSIAKQDKETIEQYGKLFDYYEIEQNDENKSIVIMLNVFVNLCIRCTESTNKDLQGDIIQTINIIAESGRKLPENVQKLFSSGKAYAESASDESKKEFVKVMRDTYLPYTSFAFIGEEHE